MTESLNTAPALAVIFDLDGTLVDSEPLSTRVWREIHADYGVPFPDTDEVGGTVEVHLDRLSTHTGRSADALYVAYWEQLERSYATALKPVQAIYDLAVALHRARVPIAVASNSRHERVVTTMQLALPGLTGIPIVAADDVPHPKPAPDMLLRAATILGVPSDRCLVVDDSATGIQAAQRAGMTSVQLFAVGRGKGELVPGHELVGGS